MMDMGVASPSAQGQAMMSTDTAFTSACASRGSGPHTPQTSAASSAMRMTAGTNHAATLSARLWMGARLRWAAATCRTIWARSVSLPTRRASMRNDPVPLSVPAVTASPIVFSLGRDSPVSRDSSTALWPSTTTPSTGTFSPGRTRRRSPGCTSASGTSVSAPSAATRRAVFGASPSRLFNALEVALRARSSNTWPSKASAVMTAAASKYTGGNPPWVCILSGIQPGASVATRLNSQATPTPMAMSVNMFGLRCFTESQAR